VKAGFSLIELLSAIALLSILLAIAIPTLYKSKSQAQNMDIARRATMITNAITRAQLNGDEDPSLTGNDINAAVSHLLAAGYLTPIR
jgi:prepilin-type N-terminal cleavage/methylation domain-containing protein